MGRLPARLEATREGHPATDWGHLPQIFKDRRRRSGHPEDRGALPAVQPYLRASRFQGCRCLRATARPAFLKRNRRSEDCQRGKRTLPRASVDVSGLVYVTVVRPRPKPSLARSPIPVQESRPGSLSLAGTTPLSNSPLAKRAPRGGPPSPADHRRQAHVAMSPPPSPAESGGNPRDIGAVLPPPRHAIAHPRHAITRPLRTD